MLSEVLASKQIKEDPRAFKFGVRIGPTALS